MTINKKEVLVFWEDAVLFSFDKPKTLPLKAHKGIILKEDKNFLIIKNPKEIIYSRNKLLINKKFSPSFLFLPKGMILKIISMDEVRKKLKR